MYHCNAVFHMLCLCVGGVQKRGGGGRGWAGGRGRGRGGRGGGKCTLIFVMLKALRREYYEWNYLES